MSELMRRIRFNFYLYINVISTMNTQSCFKLIQEENDGHFSSFSAHHEASDYSGCEYTYNDSKIIQRMAKQTPKKIGQFVTLWKRDSTSSETAPFHIEDGIDYALIICFNGNMSGRFLFPKRVLIEKGIITDGKMVKGKRGFRVYPAWDRPKSKQAIQSQKWQEEYFSDVLKL